MRNILFFIILLTVYEATGECEVFLTSREFSALYLASSVFSTTNNIRKFEVNVEDNGSFIKVTFFKGDVSPETLGGGGEIYTYHIDPKKK
ncbi:hypothetical protein [Hafnia alvei]|uniref:hypothetical protein n=1 Tax=Hafnia alvei TaxID=569 RepID=UPI0010342AC1|nr:hypothetical protein [Hafnia alvei]TBL89121.1 hypothetical protein EYY88_03665 [Hafnia alvei]